MPASWEPGDVVVDPNGQEWLVMNGGALMEIIGWVQVDRRLLGDPDEPPA